MNPRTATAIAIGTIAIAAACLPGCYRSRVYAPAPAGGYGPPDGPEGAVVAEPGSPPFHDELSRHGTWTDVRPYGPVWRPAGVPADWRPYTVGQWVYTDAYGWTWQSEEPWGWATDHYGRWNFSPQLGWFWVPGTEWAPAWVAWREGGDYIGWAPLPPGVEVGVAVPDSVVLGIPVAWWCFVRVGVFVEPHIGRHIVPIGRNAVLVRDTRHRRAVRVVDGRIVDRSIDPVVIERATGHGIRHFEVIHRGSVAERRGVLNDHQVGIYDPHVARTWRGGGTPAPSRGGRPAPEGRGAREDGGRDARFPGGRDGGHDGGRDGGFGGGRDGGGVDGHGGRR